MGRTATSRRRPNVRITPGRAARLHRLVRLLAEGPQPRDSVLKNLTLGLRTFYRELRLLQDCRIKVVVSGRLYALKGTVAQAEERLPFPDPQLSFAEMAELARGDGPAARRLEEMLRGVLGDSESSAKPGKKRAERQTAKKRA
jgi:hypothetical protein